jgi:glucose/arabinose dehydrogenase
MQRATAALWLLRRPVAPRARECRRATTHWKSCLWVALNGAPSEGAPGSDGSGDAGSPLGTPVPLIPGTESALQLAPYVTGLNHPVFVTHAPGETDRLFVLEQEGRIRVIRNGSLNAVPIWSSVWSCSPGSRACSAWRSTRTLLTVPTVDGYHNAGSINLGPDSLLYIGLGDGRPRPRCRGGPLASERAGRDQLARHAAHLAGAEPSGLARLG